MSTEAEPEREFVGNGRYDLAQLPDGGCAVKILDFGQSRVMEAPSLQTIDQSGAVVGSVYMLSPEQLTHEELDCLTDSYSLGCVFYQALTMQRPSQGCPPWEPMLHAASIFRLTLRRANPHACDALAIESAEVGFVTSDKRGRRVCDRRGPSEFGTLLRGITRLPGSPALASPNLSLLLPEKDRPVLAAAIHHRCEVHSWPHN